jgi:hypothetical protein
MAPNSAKGFGRPRLLPNDFTLALLFASLLSGLLTLQGAVLLEPTSATAQGPWPGCVALQAGSPNAGTTHILLENGGPEISRIRLDWIDNYGGLKLPTIDDGGSIEPWASADIQFRTPGMGAVVQVRSSVANLHARAEVRRDDGGATETRQAFLCLGR